MPTKLPKLSYLNRLYVMRHIDQYTSKHATNFVVISRLRMWAQQGYTIGEVANVEQVSIVSVSKSMRRVIHKMQQWKPEGSDEPK